MFLTNPERNERIYRLWEKGLTVDEIVHELPDIPRSTVGYYVRKFNRYAKEGRPIILPQKAADHKQQVANSALTKIINMATVIEILKKGEDREFLRFLRIWKLLKELGFMPSREESEELQQILLKAMQSPKSASSERGTGENE